MNGDLADLLFVAAVTLFIIEVVAVVGLSRLSRGLRGKPGGRFARATLVLAVIATISQMGAVVNATLINFVDPVTTLNIRLVVFFFEQLILAVAVVWTFRTLNRISRTPR